MAYVGMTPRQRRKPRYTYQPITGEADHQRSHIASGTQIHTLRRGNKYAAAQDRLLGLHEPL